VQGAGAQDQLAVRGVTPSIGTGTRNSYGGMGDRLDGVTNQEVLGTLSLGFLLDDAVATQLKSITGSDIAFGMDGRILATTLPVEYRTALASLLGQPGGVHNVRIGTEDYAVLPRELTSIRDSADVAAAPVALILRSRTEQLAGLQAIQAGLVVTAIVAVILATLLSFAVARTITRPLAAITDVMREVARTGDLTRKIALFRTHRWDDEDARLLATTFNTLTDSIARFQRGPTEAQTRSTVMWPPRYDVAAIPQKIRMPSSMRPKS